MQQGPVHLHELSSIADWQRPELLHAHKELVRDAVAHAIERAIKVVADASAKVAAGGELAQEVLVAVQVAVEELLVRLADRAKGPKQRCIIYYY